MRSNKNLTNYVMKRASYFDIVMKKEKKHLGLLEGLWTCPSPPLNLPFFIHANSSFLVWLVIKWIKMTVHMNMPWLWNPFTHSTKNNGKAELPIFVIYDISLTVKLLPIYYLFHISILTLFYVEPSGL